MRGGDWERSVYFIGEHLVTRQCKQTGLRLFITLDRVCTARAGKAVACLFYETRMGDQNVLRGIRSRFYL